MTTHALVTLPNPASLAVQCSRATAVDTHLAEHTPAAQAKCAFREKTVVQRGELGVTCRQVWVRVEGLKWPRGSEG